MDRSDKATASRPVSAATAPATVPLDEDLRPDPQLLTYYALSSLLLGPFFVFALVPLWFRYRTLRYRFDAEGVSMRWGILFRREVHLTYARIQDIHLTSNVVERWLGLARVQVQTASGSSKAEMAIEGRRDFEAIRDFLYRRMRGMLEDAPASADAPEAARAGKLAGGGAPRGATPAPGDADDLATVLLAVAGELREVRRALAGGHGAERLDAGAPEAGDREAGGPASPARPAAPSREERS